MATLIRSSASRTNGNDSLYCDRCQARKPCPECGATGRVVPDDPKQDAPPAKASSSSRSTAAAAADPIAEWDQLVQLAADAGHRQPTAHCIRHHPERHRAYLEAFNRQQGRPRAAARLAAKPAPPPHTDGTANRREWRHRLGSLVAAGMDGSKARSFLARAAPDLRAAVAAETATHGPEPRSSTPAQPIPRARTDPDRRRLLIEGGMSWSQADELLRHGRLLR